MKSQALKFVNVHGASVAVPLAAKPVAPPKDKPEPYAMSLGFVVHGWTDSMLKAAERLHEAKQAQRGDKAKPFSREAVLKRKGRRITRTPYALRAGAEEFMALAERNGWLALRVIELTRNVVKEQAS